MHTDTIAAIATAPGRGGIGVVRLSGPLVKEIAHALIRHLPSPRIASLRTFRDRDGGEIDRGLAFYFAAPLSFTGEDILELHAHGGPIVLDMLLARVIELGARQAQPGEFSQRAFLNDKIDLTQAEAIADLIDSGSQQAARAAMRSLQGEFSIRAQSITDQLIEARMYVEAAIDFPEEEIDFLQDRALQQRLSQLAASIDDTLKHAQQGALLRDGITIVIAGKPNAGKSSLLNALAGYDAAIVTAIPGTTRDLLRERINIDGLPMHVIDTAGLRETQDLVESEGIKRAHHEMSKADGILYLVDTQDSLTVEQLEHEIEQLPKTIAVTIVYNKIDLALPTQLKLNWPTLAISVRSGEGISALRQHLKERAGLQEGSNSTFSARRRHLDALRRAQQRVQTSIQLLSERKAGELMAEELRLAQYDIGEITGEFSSEDLLGKIFSSFCIGK